MAADEDEAKDSATSGTEPGGKPGQDRRARERRQRPPVTIDLAAEDVRKAGAAETPTPAASAAEPPPAVKPSPAATPEPPRPPPEKPAAASPGPTATFASSAEALRGAAFRAFANDDGWQRHMLSGVAGGVVALIIVIVLQAIGLLPAPGRSAANRALEQAQMASETAVTLDHRLSTVEAMTEGLPALRTEIEGTSDRVAALEKAGGSFAAKSDLQTVASGLAALRQQVGEAPAAATAKDLTALNDRITRLEVTAATGSGTTGDGSAAIASLTSQLAQAEASLRSLNDRLAAAEARMTTGGATGSAGAVQAIAVAALRRAAESDKPFAADLDSVSALGVAGDDIAKLRPIAEKGVPAAATLAAEFPARRRHHPRRNLGARSGRRHLPAHRPWPRRSRLDPPDRAHRGQRPVGHRLAHDRGRRQRRPRRCPFRTRWPAASRQGCLGGMGSQGGRPRRARRPRRADRPFARRAEDVTAAA